MTEGLAVRHCIGCNAEITACMGFQLARDIKEQPGNIRELCWKCAWRCASNPALLDILTEEDT